MKRELSIVDVVACYKNIDENNVSAILEVKRINCEDYEMILKYTFSINSLEKNSIEIYKDLNIPEIYDIYLLLKDNINYKGIFDIYFRIYQNELDNLRFYAIEKLNELNNPKDDRESKFEQVKDNAKKLWQELLVEGSSNELNGTITRVAAYIKESNLEKGIPTNRCVIDVIRYGTDYWEHIYSYEYGKYRTGGESTDINNVSIYKQLDELDIFKVMSLLDSEEEYIVMSKYLKTVPKRSSGDIKVKEEKQKEENIKFL